MNRLASGRSPRFGEWLQGRWYSEQSGPLWLVPFEWLFVAVSAVRRLFYRTGLLSVRYPGAPVIVVGNISVGGAGKTPVVAWLVGALGASGFRPAILSRGYRGHHRGAPIRVDSGADPTVVGDEPVMLARATGCPVFVCRDRLAAAEAATASGADVLVADDGLQHYRLGRDIEVAVVDAARGVGNGSRLPRGPLRESTERLCTVDFVWVNGESWREWNAGFRLAPTSLESLDRGTNLLPEEFAGRRVRALAGIGDPDRFYRMLMTLGMKPIAIPVSDHGVVDVASLLEAGEGPLLMTAKDAVKYADLGLRDAWVFHVGVVPNDAMNDDFEAICNELGGGRQ